jgi:hypothetical protein
VARIALKRAKRREGEPPQPALWRNDVIAVALGMALYLLFGAYLHPLLIGVPAFPS